MKRVHPFNAIGVRSRSRLLNLELISQAREAMSTHQVPTDVRALLQAFPMVAALLGAGRAALIARPVDCLIDGFVFLGVRYRVHLEDRRAFRVTTWLTDETLARSPPNSL